MSKNPAHSAVSSPFRSKKEHILDIALILLDFDPRTHCSSKVKRYQKLRLSGKKTAKLAGTHSPSIHPHSEGHPVVPKGVAEVVAAKLAGLHAQFSAEHPETGENAGIWGAKCADDFFDKIRIFFS